MRVRRILVVDDDRGSLDACARALSTLPEAEVEREERSTDALRRVGSTREQEVDVRIVAAMSGSPERLVEDDRLREDLMYRLNVGRIDLPPLRDRSDDIPLLVERFLQRYATDGQPTKVEDDAMAILRGYDWPGNVS